jgi:hypothetical protein
MEQATRTRRPGLIRVAEVNATIIHVTFLPLRVISRGLHHSPEKLIGSRELLAVAWGYTWTAVSLA